MTVLPFKSSSTEFLQTVSNNFQLNKAEKLQLCLIEKKTTLRNERKVVFNLSNYLKVLENLFSFLLK